MLYALSPHEDGALLICYTWLDLHAYEDALEMSWSPGCILLIFC
jgi:hypothetical protein